MTSGPHSSSRMRGGVPRTASNGGRPTGSGKRYVASLDGLRAICCIGVVLYHIGLSHCQGGLLGVTVLFVLSGYLATAGLLRELATTRTIKVWSYWKRRLWRLMPQVIAFLVVTACLTATLNQVLFTKLRQDFLPALLGYLNWAKIFGNESYFAAAEAPSPVTHFWSLAIEAQFFLVWPLVLLLLRRLRVRMKWTKIGTLAAVVVSTGLMAVLYTPGTDPSRAYYGTDTRAQSLLLGAFVAMVWPMRKRSSKPMAAYRNPRDRALLNAGSVVAPLAIVVLMVATNGYSSFSYWGGTLLVSVVAAVALESLLVPGTVGNRVLSLGPLAWVGKRSYAIYLWHFPIVELLNPRNATVPLAWWQVLLQLLLVIAVAELSYVLVEQPFSHGHRQVVDWFRQAGGVGHGSGQHDEPSGLLRSSRVPRVAAAVACCVLVAWAGVAMAVVPDAGAAAEADQPKVMRANLKKPLVDGVYDVVLIGDSVSLGAHDNLSAEFPHGLMDTEGNREIDAGMQNLQSYLDEGVVGDTVVISLGTNGVLSEEDLEKIHQMVGNDRQLYFVNLRSPNAKDIDNNELINSFVAKYDNVHLIDWHGATEGHSEYLIEDGIHLTEEGRDAYATLVRDTIGYEEPNEENTHYSLAFVGDDVALDAADQLAAAYPMGAIDTADRTPDEILEALKSYTDGDLIGSNVAVSVGCKQPLQKSTVEQIVAAAGERRVWLINTRTASSFCTDTNATLQEVADEHDNVQLVDWYGASAGHSEYLQEDGAHLTEAGAQAYAKTLLDATGDLTSGSESGKGTSDSEEATDEDAAAGDGSDAASTEEA